MATVTVSASGGTRNWSDTATWVGGALPLASDDIVANATSGTLTVDSNRTCLTINFTGYVNTFTINNGITLTVSGTVVTLGAVMTYNQTTTGILSTFNAQATITITFAGITIPNLTIGKTNAGTQTITISGVAPTIKNLITTGTILIVLVGTALTITNSITLNQTINSGPTMTFSGTVTMSGAGILNTGFTVLTGSTLIIGSNVSASGNITFASGSFLIPGTFTFTISSTCTLDSNVVTWYNLNTTSNGHVVTLTSDLNISNNLTWAVPNFGIQIGSATVRTITVQGSVTSTAQYSRTFNLNNIILNMTGRGTFAVASVTPSAGTTCAININTSDPIGYVIGSATFTGANSMQLNGLTFTLVGTSVASAFSGTTLYLGGATLDTNRSLVNGSNPIYGAIIVFSGANFTTETTCLGSLSISSPTSGAGLNGAKVLFGGSLTTTVISLGTTTLEFIGSGAAIWGAGTYQNNIIVNKSGGAIVTTGASITYGAANRTLTMNSPVNFLANSTTLTLSGTPLTINNFIGSPFFNMTIPNTVTLILNGSTSVINNNLTLNGNAVFQGTVGWTCGTLTCSTAGSTITLREAVTYTTTNSVTMLGTNASRILMRSSDLTSPYVLAKWTLTNTPAAQSMIYVSATAIDSSAGMTIYSFQGTTNGIDASTLNWGAGSQPATKSFTFVC